MHIKSKELARLLGLTERRIEQLTNDGVLTKLSRGIYDDATAIDAYITYKINKASETTDLTEARAKKEDKLAQIKDIELKKLKKEVISIDALEKELSDIASTLSNRLYNLSNRIKLKVEISKEQEDVINEQIEETLIELKDAKIYKNYCMP